MKGAHIMGAPGETLVGVSERVITVPTLNVVLCYHSNEKEAPTGGSWVKTDASSLVRMADRPVGALEAAVGNFREHSCKISSAASQA